MSLISQMAEVVQVAKVALAPANQVALVLVTKIVLMCALMVVAEHVMGILEVGKI